MQKFKVAHLFGIPIYIDLTIGLLMAYILLFLGGTIEYRAVMAVMLPVSILLHELAHSLVGKLFGGHIVEITLYLLGGRAVISRMPYKPWQELLVALAGPAMSILLGFLFWGAFYLLASLSSPFSITLHFLLDVFASLCLLNFGLAIFNLMPAFPMDGGRILRSALECCMLSRVKATTVAVVVGRVFAVFWFTLWVSDFIFGVHIDVTAWNCPEWMMFIFAILFSSGGIVLPLIAYMIWISGMQELNLVRQEADYYGD